jgi:hypothetical protein
LRLALSNRNNRVGASTPIHLMVEAIVVS